MAGLQARKGSLADFGNRLPSNTVLVFPTIQHRVPRSSTLLSRARRAAGERRSPSSAIGSPPSKSRFRYVGASGACSGETLRVNMSALGSAQGSSSRFLRGVRSRVGAGIIHDHGCMGGGSGGGEPGCLPTKEPGSSPRCSTDVPKSRPQQAETLLLYSQHPGVTQPTASPAASTPASTARKQQGSAVQAGPCAHG